MGDYKTLQAIRLRNYVFILHMIAEVDKTSMQMYSDVRKRLHDVRNQVTDFSLMDVKDI